jgi:YVTN family beta-propeller protein
LHLARIEDTTQPQSNRRPTRSAAKSVYLFALTAAALVSILGCGNTYRPVVSAVNPVGPAGQPPKYAVAISSPSQTLPGLVTFVDFSGDTVLITANLGVAPYYLALNSGGNTGYTLNGDGTVNNFGITTSLLTSQVSQTTLLAGAAPNSILPLSTSTYISEPGRNSIAQLQATSSALALKQELPIDTGFSPVYIAGATAGTRAYAISQSTTSGAPGQVAAIDVASNTISNRINVGVSPIYGVMTADGRRVFVMNQGDGTVSVINAQTNQLDVPPTGSTNPIAVGTQPVWADFAPARNELVVANAGDGVHPGTVSIINIPLCSVVTLPSNPGCDVNNPVDAVGFGQVLATVPVGANSLMVAVLQDTQNTRAYVLNQHDSTVSVVNLSTNTVTATIPVPASMHPAFIAASSGTPTGKVYVTSPETNTMTIIRTDTDTIDTTVDLQGKGIQVRVSAP